MLFVLLTLLLCILIVINSVLIKKGKIKGWKSSIIRILLWVTLIEITIFNINYYKMFFSKEPELEYSKEQISELVNNSDEKCKTIKIDNINNQVKSMYIELSNVYENESINYKIYYSDETTIGRYLGEKNYNQVSSKTKYTSIDLSRKSK